MKPIYFPSPAAFREWLEGHHSSSDELWVGFYKKATGKPSLTWSESVDQALCFGWIDGLRKSVDGGRYKIRFTPRRPGSYWSAINVKKVADLTASGLMRPAGDRAYAARTPEKTERYSFEQQQVAFTEEQLTALQANAKAWAFFESQPAGYRKMATWWVISAKREDTRNRRLATLISDSGNQLRLKQLRR